MAKKMVSIRLKPELIEHVKDQAKKTKKEFTEYVEDSLIETSQFKKKR
jgi:predicted DNA-binding protein